MTKPFYFNILQKYPQMPHESFWGSLFNEQELLYFFKFLVTKLIYFLEGPSWRKTLSVGNLLPVWDDVTDRKAEASHY